VVTPEARTLDARDAAEASKTAGVTVYLMEELGDARMRCDQLLRYIEQASKIIEQSSHKDHVFEVAGGIVRGIPETAFKLHKALQAVALAASRLDYEEIKQDLRPEKVEELERVLKDVRVRHVQRRSLPMINPGKVVQELRSLAKQSREKGRLDTDGLSSLIATLESGASKEAKEKAAAQLEAMAHALENPPQGESPSRYRLAQVLRRTLAESLELTASEGFQPQAAIDAQPRDPAEVTQALAELIKYARLVDTTGGSGDYKRMFGNMIGVLNQVYYITRIFDIEGTGYIQRAVKAIMPYTSLRPMANFASVLGFEDEKRSRYEEGKSADPTRNMSDADAKEWKQNTEEHGDKFKKEAASKAPQVIFKRMKDAVDGMLEARVKIRQVHEDLSGIRYDATGTVFTNNYQNSEIEKVEKTLYELDHTIGQAFRDVERLERTMRNTMVKSASEDEKRSRYEEGKSADPTENMSEADAEEWKANTEEYGDKFKGAAAKAEIKTPDLETIKAIGKGKGTFGDEYYVVGKNGIMHSWNTRSHGKNLEVAVRYKLRNEFDIPTKRVDELLKELGEKSSKAASSDPSDAAAWKVA
jgi:hypothetical protein